MPEKNELTIIVKLKDLATRGLRKLGLASDQTMRRILNGVGNLATKFVKLNLAIVGATVAMVTLAGLRLKKLADEFDFVGKSAKRFGLTTESILEVRHAAELSGVKVEALRMAMQRLNRTAEQVKDGNTEIRREFERLGIQADELFSGGRANFTEILAQVADGMKGIESSTERVDIAFKLLGDSGPQLLSLLESGGDSIRGMADEARNLGLVLSEGEVARFETYNDALTKVKRAIQGVEVAIALEILPGLSLAMSEFADDIVRDRERIVESMLRMAVEGGRHLIAFGQIFGTALTVIQAKMQLLLIVFQSLVTIYTTGAALIDKIAGSQDEAARSAQRAKEASDRLMESWDKLFSIAEDPEKLSRQVAALLKPLEEALAKIDAARALPAGTAAGKPVVVTAPAPKGADEAEKLTELQKLVGGLDAGLESLQKRWGDTFETAKTAAIAAGNAIESSITSGLEGMILGTTKVSDAFKEMGKGILRALAQVIAKLIATRVLMAAFGGGGGGGGILGGILGGGESAPSSLGGGGPEGPSSLPSGLGGGGFGPTQNNEVNLTIVANDAKGFDRLLRERRRTLEDLISNALQSRRDLIVDVRRT